MLHKYKIEDIGDVECLMRIVDHMEAHVKRISPNLFYKLIFKCEKNELVRGRRLASIPFGIALGYFIYWMVFQSIEFTIESKFSEIAMWSMIATITAGYVVSVQARCVLLLIVPTLLTGMMRSLFYLLLFQNIFFDVLFAKFLEIILKIAKTIFCFFSFSISLKAWLWRERVGPVVRNLIDVIADSKEQFDFSNNRDTMSNIVKQSGDHVDNFYKQCAEQMKGVVQKCGDIIGWTPLAIFTNTPFIGKYIKDQICKSIINKKTDGDICVRMRDSFKKAIDDMNAKASDAFAFKTGEPVSTDETMSLKVPDVSEWEKSANWDDFNSFQDDVLGNFSVVVDLLDSAKTFTKLVTIVIFFWGLTNALKYHKEYLSSLIFENFYIDRYFRHIDKRRKASNKEYLLPLRGVDLDDLVPLFSLTMTKRERQSKFLKYPFIIAMIFFAGMLVALNIILGDFLNFLSDELNFVYTIKVNNSFQPEFKNWNNGTNTITIAFSKLLKGVRFNETDAEWQFDLNQCRETADRLHPVNYIGTGLHVLWLVGILFSSTYLARMRKVICDYFYHRYSKERTLYLYNDRLRRRLAYLRQRKAQLKEAVKATKIFEKKFDMCYTAGEPKFPKGTHCLVRFILTTYDWWVGKSCFVCVKQIKLPYFDCETPDCRLLYCEVCFADVRNRCLNCRKKQKNERFALYN